MYQGFLDRQIQASALLGKEALAVMLYFLGGVWFGGFKPVMVDLRPKPQGRLSEMSLRLLGQQLALGCLDRCSDDIQAIIIGTDALALGFGFCENPHFSHLPYYELTDSSIGMLPNHSAIFLDLVYNRDVESVLSGRNGSVIGAIGCILGQSAPRDAGGVYCGIYLDQLIDLLAEPGMITEDERRAAFTYLEQEA